jgi:hypothetical protein
VVFADPDNGIVDNQDFRKSRFKFGKRISLEEVRHLSDKRCAIIYHHNSRRKGGHDAEVDYWLNEIGRPAVAVRATCYSSRTFFVINFDDQIIERVERFCKYWSEMKVRLHVQRGAA